MKIMARVRRRKDGTFQALVQEVCGRTIWACDHPHNYGTSNRVKQDSASKCGFAQVKKMRDDEKGKT